jgi:hypothetical protein
MAVQSQVIDPELEVRVLGDGEPKQVEPRAIDTRGAAIGIRGLLEGLEGDAVQVPLALREQRSLKAVATVGRTAQPRSPTVSRKPLLVPYPPARAQKEMPS